MQGFQGNTGIQGSVGFQGTQGPIGFQGIQGNIGIQGHQGTQGLIGFQGIQGFQGNLGIQGFQGSQGPIGFQGLQGLQGAQGNVGIQGYQGLQGPIGFQGLQGRQGFQGLQGTTGSQGLIGLQGSIGIGLLGTQGPSGPQGFQGAQGLRGFQGSQGMFPYSIGQGLQISNSKIKLGVDPATWNTSNANYIIEDMYIISGDVPTSRFTYFKLSVDGNISIMNTLGSINGARITTNYNGNISLLSTNSSVSGDDLSLTLNPTNGVIRLLAKDPANAFTCGIFIGKTSGVYGLIARDDNNKRGIQYEGDYEATFVNRSLVTKQYVTSALSSYIPSSAKGQPNGVASLDSNGKILNSVIPDPLLGAVVYKSTYSVVNNTPTLPTASILVKGNYYIASDSGTLAVNGLFYNIGDWVICDGTKWDIIRNSSSVQSVNGSNGIVVINSDNLPGLSTKLDLKIDKISTTGEMRVYSILGNGSQSQLSIPSPSFRYVMCMEPYGGGITPYVLDSLSVSNNTNAIPTSAAVMNLLGIYNTNVKTISANTTLNQTYSAVLCDASINNNSLTVTLPSAALNVGKLFTIKK